MRERKAAVVRRALVAASAALAAIVTGVSGTRTVCGRTERHCQRPPLPVSGATHRGVRLVRRCRERARLPR